MVNPAMTAIFVNQPERRLRFIGRAIQDVSRYAELSRILYRESLAFERRKLAIVTRPRDIGEHKDEPAGPSSA
jgi:hypothetical protein